MGLFGPELRPCGSTAPRRLARITRLIAAVPLSGVLWFSGHDSLQVTAENVSHALDLYDDSQFERSLELLERIAGGVDDLFKTFDRDATKWAERRVARADRRTLVAATVALEIARSMRGKPDDHAGRFLVWSSRLVRGSRVHPLKSNCYGT